MLWCVESNTLEGCIGLNAIFAQRIGISEGTAVSITICPPPPALSQVTIHPDSEDDLYILVYIFFMWGYDVRIVFIYSISQKYMNYLTSILSKSLSKLDFANGDIIY